MYLWKTYIVITGQEEERMKELMNAEHRKILEDYYLGLIGGGRIHDRN